jgi:hypothetical protein
MEEFSALAARVAASVVELRGCLILSRDGLVLGAFPEGDEGLVKPAWLRFAAVGEPEKGFIEFGDEIWTYVRRGPFAAFAISGLGVRPGLLIDQLDQMLYTAEEVRTRREGLRVPDVPPPSEKPRTGLQPEARPSVRTSVPNPAPPIAPPSPDDPASVPPEPAPSHPASAEPPHPAPAEPPPASAEPPPAERPSTGPVERKEETEVDRVALAQELSKLLQETGDSDENQ